MSSIKLVSEEFTSKFVTGPDVQQLINEHTEFVTGPRLKEFLNASNYVTGPEVEHTIDSCSKFVTGPELETKQDKLIAGDNISISTDNVISASTGKMQPCEQVIYDIFPCGKSFRPLATSWFPIDLEINLNCSFPYNGWMKLTHIIIPRLKVDRSGYYVGYAKNYKEAQTLRDFYAVTSKPCNIENDGENTFIYNVECVVGGELYTFGDLPVGPTDGEIWTGWLNSSKPITSTKIAYYTKSTGEDGEDIYTYVDDVPAYCSQPVEEPFPIFVANDDVYSTNPSFNPDAQYVQAKAPTFLIRPRMYPNYYVAVGIRHVFKPNLNWPADHKVATPPAE